MPQLVHIVLMKIRSDAPAARVADALAAIGRLKDQIDGVKDIHVGSDISVERLQNEHTHGAVVFFADERARERYLRHPAHLAVGAHLEPLVEKTTVVDIQI